MRRRGTAGDPIGLISRALVEPMESPMRHHAFHLMLTVAGVALGAALLPIGLTSSAGAQSAPTASPKPATAPDNPAALPDQEIGRRFTIKADDLPPPKAG